MRGDQSRRAPNAAWTVLVFRRRRGARVDKSIADRPRRRVSRGAPPIRILIIITHDFLPQLRGGSQVSTYDLARALKSRGVDTAILSSVSKRGTTALYVRAKIKLSQGLFASSHYMGCLVYRSWKIDKAISGVVTEFKPDAVIVQSMDAGSVLQALSGEAPTIVYFRNAEEDSLNDYLTPDLGYIANSEFVAKFVRDKRGLQADVVPPLIDRARYIVKGRRPRVVTFINPVVEKGLDIAIAVAGACPDIPFEFVEGWPLKRPAKAALQQRLAALPNVKLSRGRSDMRPLYARTKVLLAPSRWAEAWGRVATEAQVNAIPVLASRIGGLGEAVGIGGILIDPAAPPSVWVGALRSIWDDEENYRRLSELAIENSRRDYVDPRRQVESVLAVVDRTVAAFKARARGVVTLDSP